MKRVYSYWKYIGIVLFFLTMNAQLFAQFSEDSLIHFEVQGNDTDPQIILDGAKMHQVLYKSTSEHINPSFSGFDCNQDLRID